VHSKSFLEKIELPKKNRKIVILKKIVHTPHFDDYNNLPKILKKQTFFV